MTTVTAGQAGWDWWRVLGMFILLMSALFMLGLGFGLAVWAF